MRQIDLTQTHDVIGAYHQCDFDNIRHRYADPATQYAFDVLNKKVVSGYLIKLAAFRHLRDLQRTERGDFNYHYDLKEVDKILKFAKIAPNVDTDEPTALMNWQQFIFGMIFGWRDDKNKKRFTRVILSVARG